jgi:outer membrane beta-barrel protein
MRFHLQTAIIAVIAVMCGASANVAAQGAPPAGMTGDDPPEPGEDAMPTEDAGGAMRIPCLEDLSPEGDTRKGVQQREFLKDNRVEISALGGLYASDVLSSTYLLGGAVAYFPSEDFGIEFMLSRSPVNFGLEQPFSAFDQEQNFQSGDAWQSIVSLLYAPFHAKFKFSEASIVSGDIFVVGGAGRTFHETVQGLTWEAGAGMKLYLWKYLTFRLDIRDYILPQEVLGRGRITNNLAVMGGFSTWLF